MPDLGNTGLMFQVAGQALREVGRELRSLDERNQEFGEDGVGGECGRQHLAFAELALEGFDGDAGPALRAATLRVECLDDAQAGL